MMVMRKLELERVLDELTRLLHLAVIGQQDFVENAIGWLAEISMLATMPTHVRSALAREATLAATAVKGYRDPALPEGIPARRALSASLALCLTRAEVVLQDELRVVRQRLTDARDKIVQLLAVSSKNYALELRQEVPVSLQAMQLWQLLSSNGPETKAMVTYLSFSVSNKDRQHLMEEIVSHALQMSASSALPVAASS